MAAPVNKAKFMQDINAPIKAVYGGGLMFSKDNLSNVISVDIVDDGQPFEVTGTVSGTVIRSDGTTVPVNTGAISGNTVSLTLTEACFDVPGQIVVNIIVTNGDVKCCVLRAVYTVVPTETSEVVDPGDILPSIADLIDDIDAAVASIPADYSGLLASIAGTFSTSTAYAAGVYVWYDGTLYRFNAAHAAGSWTGSDATVVTIGGEISGIHNGFRAFANTSNLSIKWSQGGLSATSASSLSAGNRIRTFSTLPQGIIGLKTATGTAAWLYAFNRQNEYVGRWTNVGFSKSSASGVSIIALTDVLFPLLTSDDYIYKIVLRNTDDSAIDPSAGATVLYYTTTDTTLAEPGKSADAYATGEAINDLNLITGNNDTGYPEIVNASMSRTQFVSAFDGALNSYAELCLCDRKSFMALNGTSTFEEAFARINNNFRWSVYEPGISFEKLCKRINKAFAMPIRRFCDAKKNLTVPCDFSLGFTERSGEPSLYVSPDGGTLYVYGYANRWYTNDGVKWYGPESLTMSDNKGFGHAGFSVIDDTIFMVAREYTSPYNLKLYTSPITDGLNFTLRGVPLAIGHDFGDGLSIDNWGNSYLLKDNDTYYLYVEGRQNVDGNFWDIYLVTCTDPFVDNGNGTIGNWQNVDVAPILIGNNIFPTSTNRVACGNPEIAHGTDNRPVRVNGKWYMYFHSTAFSYSFVLRACSDDLVHWTYENIMFDNRDRPTAGENQSSNADHAIIEFKGRTYFFYTIDINTTRVPKLRYMIDDRPMLEMLKLIP